MEQKSHLKTRSFVGKRDELSKDPDALKRVIYRKILDEHLAQLRAPASFSPSMWKKDPMAIVNLWREHF